MTRARAWQRWLILAHAVLALAMSVLIPPWEANDETGHWAHVAWILDTGSLPDLNTPHERFLDQTHQPPPYYLVASALAAWVKRGDGIGPLQNPFTFDGTNRNGIRLFLRQAAEAFPWQGTVLALHMARLASVLFSTLNVWLLARLARLLFDAAPVWAVAMTALAAFQPEAFYVGSIVNNDVLVNVIGAWILLQIMTIARRDAAPSWRAVILLGVALGLGIASKRTGFSLVLGAGLAMLLVTSARKWPLRAMITRGVVMACAAGLAAGPVLVSNVARFGRLLPDRAADDKLLTNPALVGSGVAVALRDGWLAGMFANAYDTFWGSFGWGNLKLPPAAFGMITLLCVAGLAGVALGWRRANSGERLALGVGVLFGAGVLMLPAYRALYYHDRDLLAGRYLLPGLGACAFVLTWGWRALALRVGQSRADAWAAIPAAAFGLLAIATPALVIAPSYARPAQIAGAPEAALLSWGGFARLTAVEAEPVDVFDLNLQRNLPFVRVRLTWTATGVTRTQYAVGVSVLGRDNEVLGTANAYHAGGNWPTASWQPGDTFTDQYLVELRKSDARLPALGQVSIALFEPDQNASGQPTGVRTSLQAMDGAGRAVTPIVGRFRLPEYTAKPNPDIPQPARAIGGLVLTAGRIGGPDGALLPATLRAGQKIMVRLGYVVRSGGNPEGTAFVHAIDATGRLVGQDDHAPQGGGYPTDLWQPGEMLDETFNLTVADAAPGPIRLETGVYGRDGARFATGTPDDVHVLGVLQFGP